MAIASFLVFNHINFNIKNHIIIKSIYADAGPTMKRFRPAAMGRAVPILKRTSHLTVVVESKEK